MTGASDPTRESLRSNVHSRISGILFETLFFLMEGNFEKTAAINQTHHLIKLEFGIPETTVHCKEKLPSRCNSNNMCKTVMLSAIY